MIATTQHHALRVLGVLLATLWSQGARAGLPEDLRDVVFHPDRPECYAVLYAQVGGGLVLTCDDGESFELLCGSAVVGEVNTDALQPHAAFTDDGHLIVGQFDGLFRGDLHGCGFERVEGAPGDSVIRDVVVDPGDPGKIYALSSAGAGSNAIWVSTDGGASWEPLGEVEPFYFSGLAFAPLADGAQRMAVSLGKPNEDFTETAYFVRVSDDGGESFTELAFPEVDNMQLLGIDQQDPDRLYALAEFVGEERQAIMVNAEAGVPEAWERLGEVEEMGSFLTPPEGGFWAADVLQRQRVRSEDGTTMEALEGMRDLSGIARRGSDGQYFVARSTRLFRANDQVEETGEPLLDLFEIERFVQCEDPVDTQCRAQMMAGWCGHHFVDAPVCEPAEGGADADAGSAGDAGSGTAGDGGAAAGGGDPGSGCRAAPGPGRGPLGPVLGALLVAVFFVRRRPAGRTRKSCASA